MQTKKSLLNALADASASGVQTEDERVYRLLTPKDVSFVYGGTNYASTTGGMGFTQTGGDFGQGPGGNFTMDGGSFSMGGVPAPAPSKGNF